MNHLYLMLMYTKEYCFLVVISIIIIIKEDINPTPDNVFAN